MPEQSNAAADITLASLRTLYDSLCNNLDINKIMKNAATSKPDDFALSIFTEACEMLAESEQVSFLHMISYGNISSSHSLQSALSNMGLSENSTSILKVYDFESSVQRHFKEEKLDQDKHFALSNRNRPDGVLRMHYKDMAGGFECIGLIAIEIDGTKKLPSNLNKKDKELGANDASELHHLQAKALQGVDLCRQTMIQTGNDKKPTYSVRINSYAIDMDTINRKAKQAKIQPTDKNSDPSSLLEVMYCIDAIFRELLWVAILIAHDMYDNSVLQKKVIMYRNIKPYTIIFDYFFFVNFDLFPVTHFDLRSPPGAIDKNVFAQFTRHTDDILWANSKFLQQVNPVVATQVITRYCIPSYVVYVQRINVDDAIAWFTTPAPTPDLNAASAAAPKNTYIDPKLLNGMWYITDFQRLFEVITQRAKDLANLPNLQYLGITGVTGNPLQLEEYYKINETTMTKLEIDVTSSLYDHYMKYDNLPKYKYYMDANIQLIQRFVNFFENAFWAMHKNLVYEPKTWHLMTGYLDLLRSATRKKDLSLVQRSVFTLSPERYDPDLIPHCARKSLTTRLVIQMCQNSEPLHTDLVKYVKGFNIPYSIAFLRILGCTSPVMLSEMTKQHMSKTNPRITELLKFFPVAIQTELNYFLSNASRDLAVLMDPEPFTNKIEWLKQASSSRECIEREMFAWLEKSLKESFRPYTQGTDDIFACPLGYKLYWIFDFVSAAFTSRAKSTTVDSQIHNIIHDITDGDLLDFMSPMTQPRVDSAEVSESTKRDFVYLMKKILKECCIRQYFKYFLYIMDLETDNKLGIDDNPIQKENRDSKVAEINKQTPVTTNVLMVIQDKLAPKNQRMHINAPGAWPLRDLNCYTWVNQKKVNVNSNFDIQTEKSSMTASETNLWKIIQCSEDSALLFWKRFCESETQENQQLQERENSRLAAIKQSNNQPDVYQFFQENVVYINHFSEFYDKKCTQFDTLVENIEFENLNVDTCQRLLMTSMRYSSWKVSSVTDFPLASRGVTLTENEDGDTWILQDHNSTSILEIPDDALKICSDGLFLVADQLSSAEITTLQEHLRRDSVLKCEDKFYTCNFHKTKNAWTDKIDTMKTDVVTHAAFKKQNERTRNMQEWCDIDKDLLIAMTLGSYKETTHKDKLFPVIRILFMWKKLLICTILKDTMIHLQDHANLDDYRLLLYKEIRLMSYKELKESNEIKVNFSTDWDITGNSTYLEWLQKQITNKIRPSATATLSQTATAMAGSSEETEEDKIAKQIVKMQGDINTMSSKHQHIVSTLQSTQPADVLELLANHRIYCTEKSQAGALKTDIDFHNYIVSLSSEENTYLAVDPSTPRTNFKIFIEKRTGDELIKTSLFSFNNVLLQTKRHKEELWTQAESLTVANTPLKDTFFCAPTTFFKQEKRVFLPQL